MKNNHSDQFDRLPKNAEGSFYTLGQKVKNGEWCGACLSCGVPEAEAPTLLAPLTSENSDTYFVRQPVTELEIEQACNAVEVCCVDALRYGGKDAKIIARLGSRYCDYTSSRSKFETNNKKWYEFWK